MLPYPVWPTATSIRPRGLGVIEFGSRPASEEWWKYQPVHDDIQPLLLGMLTAPEAVTNPILILGQPGSGKSVLSRILAARLGEGDFFVVRVELRNVPADAPVHSQITEAIDQLLGRRIDWPTLAGDTGGALPVVIFDGFDELLQATKINRARRRT